MLIKEISLKKWGNSQGLRFTKEELELLGETDGNVTFQMIVEKGKITLTPIKKMPQTLDDLFADYNGEPLGEEDRYEWDELVGRELI